MAELMGKDFKYLRVLLRCALDDLLVYHRYARTRGVVYLNSWGRILNTLGFCQAVWFMISLCTINMRELEKERG